MKIGDIKNECYQYPSNVDTMVLNVSSKQMPLKHQLEKVQEQHFENV